MVEGADVVGVPRRKSTDITRAELISIVARLRGALYGVLGGESDGDEIRSLLAQTAFDCDGDSFDRPESSGYRIGTNIVQIETAIIVRVEGDNKDQLLGPIWPPRDSLIKAFVLFLARAGQDGIVARAPVGAVAGSGLFNGAFTPESEGVIRQWFESRMSEEPSDGAPGSFPGEGK